MVFRYVVAVFFGICSGAVIAGAVFAFIAAIGVVTRLAQKTDTVPYVMLYEEVMLAGALLGICAQLFSLPLPIGVFFAVGLSLLNGIFWGCLAMSLAEVLDALPILSRRIRVERFMYMFVVAIAVGKVSASLMYFIIPGFFEHQ